MQKVWFSDGVMHWIKWQAGSRDPRNISACRAETVLLTFCLQNIDYWISSDQRSVFSLYYGVTCTSSTKSV